MQKLNSSVNSLSSSSAKQRYSFTRSPRFQSHAKPINQSFYDLPSTTMARSTSFGYGRKDLGLRFEKVSPSPEAYHIQSDFTRARRGFSFGQGREDMQITGPLAESITKKYIPSPDAYNPRLGPDCLNITMKPRIQDRSLNHLKNLPGPGQYRLEQMGSSNYYSNSKHISHVNYKMSQSPRPDTVLQRPASQLGPGSYDLKSTELNKAGQYFNSRNRNSQARRFPREPRPQPLIRHLLTTPGPTSYKSYSDFGQ